MNNSKEQTGKEERLAAWQYVEKMNGQSNFKRTMALCDSSSMFTLMEDYADHENKTLQQRIAELEDTIVDRNTLIKHEMELGIIQMQEIEALKAELKRKDEALEDIVNLNNTWADPLGRTKRIAEQALKPKDNGKERP